MSARDDYEWAAMLTADMQSTSADDPTTDDLVAMFEELDQLRADVAKLLAKLATTDATWP